MAPGRDSPERMKRIAAMTRSGLSRYPRHLLESLQRAQGLSLRPGDSGIRRALPEWKDHALAATWLGHATVLLRMAGLWIITDPVFSHRIGPRVGALTFGLARSAPVPIEAEDLPGVDVTLISHAHFDHLDKPSLRRLPRGRAVAITARGTRRLVPRGFSRITELDWGGVTEVGPLHIHALRPRHWGARAAVDRRRGFNSYLLESDSHRVLFAGDTAMTDAFDHIPHATLAIFGIGAYGLWDHAHATPEQVWSMFRASGADYLLPIHHSTFPMGDERPDEPLQRLMQAAGPESHLIVGAGCGDVWAAGASDAGAAGPVGTGPVEAGPDLDPAGPGPA